jgi:phosphoglycerol transferase MdoB-like AlkP superfamily enzyme
MRDQDTPDSVRNFERLIYVSMAVSFCGYFINWNDTSESFHKSPLLFIIVQAVIFGIQFFWIWLVAYQRLNWARWATLAVQFVFLIVIGVGFAAYYEANSAADVAILALQTIISIVATCFLFTREATPWFVP